MPIATQYAIGPLRLSLGKGEATEARVGVKYKDEIGLRTGDGTAGESVAVAFPYRRSEKRNCGSRFRVPGEDRGARAVPEKSDSQRANARKLEGSQTVEEQLSTKIQT